MAKMESFGGLESRGAGEDDLGLLDEEARSEDSVELNARLDVVGGGLRLRFWSFEELRLALYREELEGMANGA